MTAVVAPPPKIKSGVHRPRDGIVIQDLRGGDMRGYNDDNETVNRDESVQCVDAIAAMYARQKRVT